MMPLPDKASLEVEIAEIVRLIEEYQAKISNGTSTSDNFMSIIDMEEALGTLRSGTNNIYTDLQSKLVNQIDQNELVRKKKQTTDSKG
jgi:hypothetical protein